MLSDRGIINSSEIRTSIYIKTPADNRFMLVRIILVCICATIGFLLIITEATCLPTTIAVQVGSSEIQGPSAGAAVGSEGGFGAAGDVNGDGITDFFIGSGAADACTANGCSAKTYIVFGSTTPRDVDLAALGPYGYTIEGPSALVDSFKAYAVGDISGDGLADLVVTQLFGSTFVVFGKVDTASLNAANLGNAGFEISGGMSLGHFRGVPDLDGDGIRELFLVANNTDRAYLLRGKSSANEVNLAALSGAGATITAPDNLDSGGYAGDVNGDCLPDFVLGHRNSVWIIFGDGTLHDTIVAESPGFSITGMPSVPAGTSGAIVSALGDLNGDGKTDIAIAHASSGQAWIVYGRSTTTPIDVTALGTDGYTITSTVSNQSRIIPLGDFDGNGLADYAYQGGDDYTAIVFGQPNQQSFSSANIEGIGARLRGATLIARSNAFIPGSQLLASFPEASPLGRSGAGVIAGITLPGPNFTISSTLVYTQNSEITPKRPESPTYSGPVYYAPSQPLPRGLSLDPTTGILSGTPRDVISTSSYSITATDVIGSLTRAFTIRIDPDTYSVVSPNNAAQTDSHPVFIWERASATDNTEPVSSYSIFIDGEAIGKLPAIGCDLAVCTFKVQTPVKDGTHTWSVSTLDKNSRVRNSSLGSFSVAEPPRIVLNTSAATITTGETLKVDASASRDDNGRITSFSFDRGTGVFDTPSEVASSNINFDRTGEYTIRVRVSDDAGLSSEAQAPVKVTLASRSGVVGLTINNGAVATNNPNVTLSARWPYLAETILISNDNSFGETSGTVSLPVADEIGWTLSATRSAGSPERSKMVVYAQFSGGTAGKEIYSDDIILDQQAPVITGARYRRLGSRAQSTKTTLHQSKSSTAKRRTRPVKTQRSIQVRAVDENSGVEFIEVARISSSIPLARRRVSKPGDRGERRTVSSLAVTTAMRARLLVRAIDVAGNVSRWRAVR